MKKIFAVIAITIVMGMAVFGVTSQVLARGGGPGEGNANASQGDAECPQENLYEYKNEYLYSNQNGDCLLGDAACTRTMTNTATQSGPFGGTLSQKSWKYATGMGTGVAVASEDWVQEDATVKSVDDTQIVLVLSDGITEIVIEGRQLAYLLDNDFVLAEGDTLTLSGFFDLNGFFAIGEIFVVETSESITLRNDAGLPLWAGGPGRKGGR